MVRLDDAIRQLRPQATSGSKGVASVANDTIAIYLRIKGTLERGALLDQKLVDKKPGDPMGPVLAELSSLVAEIDKTWRALPIARAGVGNLLVDQTRVGPEGKVSYLVISARERDTLLALVEETFGADVAKGLSVGKHASAGTAALLANFLRQPWRTADQK